MDQSLESIIAKVNNLCNFVREFDTKKQSQKQANKSKSRKLKQNKKHTKRQVNLYDEIPQEVLDKSYRIFRSSKLLERFYVDKYFNKWSNLIKQKHINENDQNENLNENKIIDVNQTENPTNSNDNNKLQEQTKQSENQNNDIHESFEEHTEDKSKISLNIGENEYSHENI